MLKASRSVSSWVLHNSTEREGPFSYPNLHTTTETLGPAMIMSSTSMAPCHCLELSGTP